MRFSRYKLNLNTCCIIYCLFYFIYAYSCSTEIINQHANKNIYVLVVLQITCFPIRNTYSYTKLKLHKSDVYTRSYSHKKL